MRKIFLILLFISSVAQIARAQTTTVTGSVKDDKGNPVPYAFVWEEQHTNGAYADSAGNFTITAEPGSKLIVRATGHKEATMAADNKGGNMQVTLPGDGTAASSSSAGTSSTTASSESLTSNQMAVESNSMGGFLKPGHEKGNTRGSEYLFRNFVHGYIINSAGDLINNPAYLLDYDKVDGSLVVTQDNKTINQVGWDQTKSFSLFNSAGQRFDFEKVPSIDKSHYVQVLASGKNYKIYKLIKTKYVKSDYVNNGVTSHGNDYDEYVDDADYYVLDVQGNQQKKLSLRKKSVKEAFAKDADKVNKYLSENSGDINDAYLTRLGDFMNQ